MRVYRIYTHKLTKVGYKAPPNHQLTLSPPSFSQEWNLSCYCLWREIHLFSSAHGDGQRDRSSAEIIKNPSKNRGRSPFCPPSPATGVTTKPDAAAGDQRERPALS